MPPTTLGPSWSLLCWNLTVVGRLQDGHSPAPVALWPPVAVTPPSVNVSELHRDNDGIDDRDRHALLYIVVVLLFYSTGIVVGIVMYLKREKAEIEEEKAYENYARFRSDPDQWTRYFRVQRMVAQLDRVEREAAEKRRQLSEIADEPQPPARRSFKKSPRLGHRHASPASALKVLVFGSQSGRSGTDPSPLLSTSRGTELLSLKSSRSAAGRLDISQDSPIAASDEGLIRTHSCEASSGIGRQAGELHEMKRSPKSTTMLQVSNV